MCGCVSGEEILAVFSIYRRSYVIGRGKVASYGVDIAKLFSCFEGNQWKQCLTLTENHKLNKSLKNFGLQIKRLHCFDKESV